MLFRKKDNSDSAKAKTSLFARRATKQAAESKDETVRDEGSVGIAEKATEAVHFKQTVAKGKVNPNILKYPRITEKGTYLSKDNVYVFDIAPHANKKLVAAAIRDVYGISPKTVRIVRVPTKTKASRRGLKSVVGGGKKAYVQLKQGDTIEIV